MSNAFMSGDAVGYTPKGILVALPPGGLPPVAIKDFWNLDIVFQLAYLPPSLPQGCHPSPPRIVCRHFPAGIFAARPAAGLPLVAIEDFSNLVNDPPVESLNV